MLILGKTRTIERLPKPFKNSEFQIEIDNSSNAILEFATSNDYREIDIDTEKLNIDRKSVAFFLAVSHNRLKTFATILTSLQKIESEMIRRVENNPDLSNNGLVTFHEQMMKRLTMEIALYRNAETSDVFGNSVKIFDVKQDNRKVTVNNNLPSNLVPSDLVRSVETTMNSIEELTPDGRKKIEMLVNSISSKIE